MTNWIKNLIKNKKTIIAKTIKNQIKNMKIIISNRIKKHKANQIKNKNLF